MLKDSPFAAYFLGKEKKKDGLLPGATPWYQPIDYDAQYEFEGSFDPTPFTPIPAKQSAEMGFFDGGSSLPSPAEPVNTYDKPEPMEFPGTLQLEQTLENPQNIGLMPPDINPPNINLQFPVFPQEQGSISQIVGSGVEGGGQSFLGGLGQALASLGSFGNVNLGNLWNGLGGEVSIPGLAAGAYTGYLQGTGIKDFFEGDKLDTLQQAALFPLTGGLSFFSDSLQGLFGGKSEEQKERDSIRDLLQQAGVVDENYNTTDSTGFNFNLGLDGSETLSNFGTENVFNPEDEYLNQLVGSGSRFAYELDPTNPLSGLAAGLIDPLAEVLTREGGLDDTRERASGMLVNAILQNPEIDTEDELVKEVLRYYDLVGLTPQNTTPLIQGYGLDDNRLNAYLATLDRLF